MGDTRATDLDKRTVASGSRAESTPAPNSAAENDATSKEVQEKKGLVGALFADSFPREQPTSPDKAPKSGELPPPIKLNSLEASPADRSSATTPDAVERNKAQVNQPGADGGRAPSPKSPVDQSSSRMGDKAVAPSEVPTVPSGVSPLKTASDVASFADKALNRNASTPPVKNSDWSDNLKSGLSVESQKPVSDSSKRLEPNSAKPSDEYQTPKNAPTLSRESAVPPLSRSGDSAPQKPQDLPQVKISSPPVQSKEALPVSKPGIREDLASGQREQISPDPSSRPWSVTPKENHLPVRNTEPLAERSFLKEPVSGDSKGSIGSGTNFADKVNNSKSIEGPKSSLSAKGEGIGLIESRDFKGLPDRLSMLDGYVGKTDKSTRRGEGIGVKNDSKLDGKADGKLDGKAGFKSDGAFGGRIADKLGDKLAGLNPTNKNAALNQFTDKLVDRINDPKGQRPSIKDQPADDKRNNSKSDSSKFDSAKSASGKFDTSKTESSRADAKPTRGEGSKGIGSGETIVTRLMGVPIISGLTERFKTLRPESGLRSQTPNDSAKRQGEQRPANSFTLKNIDTGISDTKSGIKPGRGIPIPDARLAPLAGKDKNGQNAAKTDIAGSKPLSGSERVIKTNSGKVPDLSPLLDTGRLFPVLIPAGLKGIKIAAQVESTKIIKDNDAPTTRVARPQIRLHLPDGTYGGQKVSPEHKVAKFEANKSQESETVPLKPWSETNKPDTSIRLNTSTVSNTTNKPDAIAPSQATPPSAEVLAADEASDDSMPHQDKVHNWYDEVQDKAPRVQSDKTDKRRKRYVNPSIDALEETLSEEDDESPTPSSASTAELLLGKNQQSKYLYLVQQGDTAESIALAQLQDIALSVLIINKNRRFVLQAAEVGSTPMRAGAQIALPNPAEIAAFRKSVQ